MHNKYLWPQHGPLWDATHTLNIHISLLPSSQIVAWLFSNFWMFSLILNISNLFNNISLLIITNDHGITFRTSWSYMLQFTALIKTSCNIIFCILLSVFFFLNLFGVYVIIDCIICKALSSWPGKKILIAGTSWANKNESKNLLNSTNN